MVDARDTYFQSDPFLFLSTTKPSLHVFNGVETIPIRQCGWNSGWIRDCFGEKMLTKIGTNNIICSGVVAGTMEVVWQYLDLMSGIVSGDSKYDSVNNVLLNGQFPRCERNGVDQGVHNVIVHNNLIPDIKTWDQSSGPVANLQAGMAIIRDNKVFNKKGELMAVVHQYDRNAGLQKYLFETVSSLYLKTICYYY